MKNHVHENVIMQNGRTNHLSFAQIRLLLNFASYILTLQILLLCSPPKKRRELLPKILAICQKCCTFFRWPKVFISAPFKTFLSIMVMTLFIYLLFIASTESTPICWAWATLYRNCFQPPMCHVVHTNIKYYTLYCVTFVADQIMKW